MSVKRYDPKVTQQGEMALLYEGMQEHGCGYYVTHYDYRAIETERDQLRAELEAARAEVKREHENCRRFMDSYRSKHPGAGHE